MALAAPTMSVQDGSAAAAVNLSANATGFVTPGNLVTVALQSSAGVQRCDFVISAPGTPLDGYRSPAIFGTPFSWQFVLPSYYEGTVTVTAEVSDGNNSSQNSNLLAAAPRSQGYATHRARNVILTNVAALATYTVAAGAQNDNVSGGNVQGDYVLLVNQSTPAQNGVYIVGLVGGGTAPLTRVPDFATGSALPPGQICEVSEGTQFGPSTWKITTAGTITVDTTSHAWFPRNQRGSGATGGGTTVSITTLWSLAATTATGGSALSANDQTGAAAVQVGAIVAGPGTGTCTLTGTTAHTITWVLHNW